MADERDPNASGPSDSAEGIIAPQGEGPGGGPSESTEGVIINQAEQPGDEPPQKDGIVIDY
jgi:hypothetical protein